MTDAKDKNLLLAFYFGAVSDAERLHVERELLTDEELLVDYLDLKRQVEAAVAVPANPSARMWSELAQSFSKKKTVWISLSMGAAIAAGLALFLTTQPASKSLELAAPSTNDALFDSSSELPASSGVL